VQVDPTAVDPAHRQAERLAADHDITGKGIANPVATFWTAAMMLEHLGEKPAAERLMKAVEHVTADPSLHTPDLGGKATTKQVTDAVCEALWQAND
jgi:tartrate dehydrogenase/decarboxylase/D-malate dehydrogenase